MSEYQSFLPSCPFGQERAAFPDLSDDLPSCRGSDDSGMALSDFTDETGLASHAFVQPPQQLRKHTQETSYTAHIKACHNSTTLFHVLLPVQTFISRRESHPHSTNQWVQELDLVGCSASQSDSSEKPAESTRSSVEWTASPTKESTTTLSIPGPHSKPNGQQTPGGLEPLKKLVGTSSINLPLQRPHALFRIFGLEDDHIASGRSFASLSFSFLFLVLCTLCSNTYSPVLEPQLAVLQLSTFRSHIP